MGGSIKMTQYIASTTNDKLHVINARVTYRKAPIHLLEKFAFTNIDRAYNILIDKSGLQECAILQTCNRVEVFGVSQSTDLARLIDGWASAVDLSENEFQNVIEISSDTDVVLHLLKLAAGLDSLVIGEDQILGQVKRAFEYSRLRQHVGSHLSILFEKAIKVGSRVRTDTALNKGSVSIGSMAVNLAGEYFDDLKTKKILIIGSGEGASLIAKSLKLRNIDFVVTSRTLQRAKSFTDAVSGIPIPFEKAIEEFHNLDLIFVSTVAPYYLVTYDRISKAMARRKKALMIFDLSNPRAVEEKVASIKKVKLINMDQIAEVVERNIRSRKNEIQSAERIVDMEMKSVDTLMKRTKVEPTIISIFKNVDEIRTRELKKALYILKDRIGPDDAKVVEQLSRAIVEGILSAPMNNLRKEIVLGEADKEEIMRAIAKLFVYENKKS
jgi:glutamyl-tRNA reductase